MARTRSTLPASFETLEYEMRRFALLLAAAVLAFTACGDDDTSSENTSAPTTAATTEAPAETTTTTQAPAATEAPAGNPLVEAALELVGTHTGEWNNTTFGTSGAIELTVDVDEATEMALVTLDLGGFVFGGDDPDPIMYELDLSIGSEGFDAYEFTGGVDDVFGETTMTFDGTDFRFVAPSVPGVGGLEMIVEGEFTEAGFDGTYTITGLAEGTLNVVANG